jgi:hypothetical protein
MITINGLVCLTAQSGCEFASAAYSASARTRAVLYIYTNEREQEVN